MTSELQVWEARKGGEIQATIEGLRTLLKVPKATDGEIQLFVQVCKAHGMNPFIGDAYLIKYSESDPASIVTGKDYYAARAEAHPQFAGVKPGIIIKNDDGLEYRPGKFLLPDEKLVGGWAEVYRKDRDNPYYVAVSLHEYDSKRSLWKTKPATMIAKVAMVQALREAFPGEFSGLYDSAELTDSDDPKVIDVPAREVQASRPSRQASRSNLDFEAIRDHVQGMGWNRGDFEAAIGQIANTAGIRRWAAEKGIEDTDHALSWLTAAHMPPESNSVEEPPEQSDYDVMNVHLFANDITHAQMSQVMDAMFNEPNFLKWMGKWDFNDVGAAIAFANNHFEIG